MRLNKKTLIKSIVDGLVLLALNVVILHTFPSLGHPPLTWVELGAMWIFWVPLLLVFTIVSYIKIEDYESKKKEREDVRISLAVVNENRSLEPLVTMLQLSLLEPIPTPFNSDSHTHDWAWLSYL